MRCCATCRGRRSPRWHRSRFPANGAAPRGGQRLSIMGLAGWVGCAGVAASPPPGPGPAAGGWAFGRLRSSASQAKRPHPCKLGRRIHAAHAPAQHPPGRGQFPCASTTEKKEKIKSGSGSLRCARSEPSMARLYRTSVRGKLSKAGWVGWRGCEPHGCGDQAPMDGFTASPAIRPTPPTRSNPAVAVAVASAGAGLQALQYNYVTQPAITSRARIASHSSSIRHTRLIASRRSGSRCHTGSSPASV